MPTKERSGILTFYLGFKLVMELLIAFVYFGGHTLFEPYSPFYFGNTPNGILIAAGLISLVNVIFVYYLFKWQKWAFWGLVFTLFIMLVIKASIGAAGSGVTIALLYALLQTKKNGVKAWDNLEVISVSSKSQKNRKIKLQKESNEIISIKNKYSQLAKLGDLFKKKILKYEEFEEEKKKILSLSTNMLDDFNTDIRFNFLEKLGELFERNILTEEEFIKEKKYF